MAGFISALIRQRKEAKKAEPSTNGRLREIIAVLKKYDYKDGITPEIVVKILEDLGPTFVKLGQIASQQAEFLPSEYCDALASLRSNAAPMDLETVHGQIEKYLGKPVEELFASFDDKPLGSASIAQVHRATLKDGTVVAVKVRRPGVVDTVARDFALIEKILDKVRTDFSFEEKALNTVTRLTGYIVRAFIIIALLIGSSLLCTTSALNGDNVAAVTVVFRSIGIVGYAVSVFFAFCLFRNMKKGK